MPDPTKLTVNIDTMMNGVPMGLEPFHLIAKQPATENTSGIAHHFFVFAKDMGDAITRVKQVVEDGDSYNSFVVEKAHQLRPKVSEEHFRSHVYRI